MKVCVWKGKFPYFSKESGAAFAMFSLCWSRYEAPYVKGVSVEGTVVANGKAKKVLVYKYKAKKNYRRTQGHRQPYTKVEIKSIKMA